MRISHLAIVVLSSGVATAGSAQATTYYVYDGDGGNGGPGGKTFGLGLQLGVPTGITGKVFLGQVVALQFGLGESLPFGGFGGWFDVVFHFVHFSTRRNDLLRMSLYLGPGINLGFAGPFYGSYYGYYGYYGYGYFSGPPVVDLNMPFGFAIHWRRVTFDTFIEIAPGVSLYPGYYFTFNGAIGGRYYF